MTWGSAVVELLLTALAAGNVAMHFGRLDKDRTYTVNESPGECC